MYCYSINGLVQGPVSGRHHLAPGVEHDAALKNGGLGFLQMAQFIEILAIPFWF